MTSSRALIGFVGQGTGGGVKVRVVQYPGLMAPEAGSQAPVHLERDWALAGDAYSLSPSPRGLTLKISRHLGTDASDWVWIALYQTARFSEDPRGGLYCGTGILLDGMPTSTDAVGAINSLFTHARTLFRGDVMTGRIDDLNVATLSLPPLTMLGPLREDRGLDPRSREGCLIPGHDVGAKDSALKDIEDSFSGSQYQPYSAVYFCQDSMDGNKRLFISNVTALRPPPPPAYRPSGSGFDNSEGYSSQEKQVSFPAEAKFDDEVLRKVRNIDHRISTIERYLSALQDPQAGVRPTPTTARGGRTLVSQIVFGIVVIFAFVGLYFIVGALWDRLAGAGREGAPSEPAATERIEGDDEVGPSVEVKEMDFPVGGQGPVRVVASITARGSEGVTSSVVVRENGQAIASAYRAGPEAAATATLTKPGNHHLVLECEAHRGSVDACLVRDAGQSPNQATVNDPVQ